MEKHAVEPAKLWVGVWGFPVFWTSGVSSRITTCLPGIQNHELCALFNNPMKQHLNTIIIAVAILAGVIVLSRTYHNRNRAEDHISVTGSASKDFVSDLIVWSGSYSAFDPDMKLASTALKKNQEAVLAYLLGKGIQEKEIIFSAVGTDRRYNYEEDAKGNTKQTFAGYSLNQSVSIESRDVEKVERVSREITDLINQGIEVTSEHPSYFYTKLAGLKIEMVAAATSDAQIRAQQIAEKSGASLGKLLFASMGVFQITAQNSTDEYEWGGSFNTTSKNKTATIAIKLQFGVK